MFQNSKLPAYAHVYTRFSMNLNQPLDFAAKLATCVVLWEIPRALSSAMVRKTYGATTREEEKRFVAAAPAYVMSTLHALVVATAGLKIGYITVMLPNANDRYYLHAKTAFKLADLKFIERWNWAFCGYMFGDLLHVLKEYPRLGKMDMVVHHACFIACSLLAGHSQTMMLPFSWLLLGEYSTPILCARWLIQQLTYELKSDVVVRWAATGEVGSLGALAARLRGGIALREVREARAANVGLTEIGRFVMIMIHVYVECN